MSERTDVNKTNKSCKCIINNYYNFLQVNFRFQPKACNGYHNLMEKAMIFNDVVIISVRVNQYRLIFW